MLLAKIWYRCHARKWKWLRKKDGFLKHKYFPENQTEWKTKEDQNQKKESFAFEVEEESQWNQRKMLEPNNAFFFLFPCALSVSLSPSLLSASLSLSEANWIAPLPLFVKHQRVQLGTFGHASCKMSHAYS